MILRLIAVVMGFAIPSLYLVIASLVRPEAGDLGNPSRTPIDMVFYILLILAALDPLLAPIIERVQIANWRRSPGIRTTDQLYVTLQIIRLAFVEACFTYGLIVYFISSDFLRMLLFYPIGLIWLAVYWPRRERFEQFLQSLRHNEYRT